MHVSFSAWGLLVDGAVCNGWRIGMPNDGISGSGVCNMSHSLVDEGEPAPPYTLASITLVPSYWKAAST